MERRAYEITELRVEMVGDEAAAKKKPKITGYAAVFEAESVDLGGFVERIARGAFAGSLEGDIRALWNHDPMHVLGRTTAGTLRVAEDERGLAIELDPPDTQTGRDVVTLIERRDVTGMSFAFSTVKDNWAKVAGRWLRTLLEVRLIDVSPCTFPAYPATEVGVRAVDARDAIEKLGGMQAEEARLILAEQEARERRLRLIGRGLDMRQAPDRSAALQRFLSTYRRESREASFEKKISAIWCALYEMLGDPWTYDGPGWCLIATFADHVIVETTPGKLFSYPITIDATNTVTVGKPVAVEAQYVPVGGSAA